MKLVTQISVVLLILLFTYTGTSKLLVRSEFVAAMKLVPFIGKYAVLLSWIVPATELTISLLLCISTTRNTGLWLSTVLMGIFTIYVLMVLAGGNLPCTCGGIFSALSWKQHLWVNVFFFVLSAASLYKNYTCRYLYS